MSDKSHTQRHQDKKPGRSVKEKRAAKKAKHAATEQHDMVAEMRAAESRRHQSPAR